MTTLFGMIPPDTKTLPFFVMRTLDKSMLVRLNPSKFILGNQQFALKTVKGGAIELSKFTLKLSFGNAAIHMLRPLKFKHDFYLYS